MTYVIFDKYAHEREETENLAPFFSALIIPIIENAIREGRTWQDINCLVYQKFIDGKAA